LKFSELKFGEMKGSTHNRSFRRRVFPDNHLHLNW